MAPPPTPDPSAPFTIEITGDGPTFTVSEAGVFIAKNADLVVIGQIVQVLPAGWTTPEGRRPANPYTAVPKETTIITPVVIRLDGPPLLNRTRRDLSSGEIAVAWYGGQVGADSVRDTAAPQPQVGLHLLLALVELHGKNPGTGGDWTVPMPDRSAPVLDPLATYVLGDDGTATSWTGSYQAAELIAAIRLAVAASATPTP